MSKFNYAKTAATSTRLIEKFGFTAMLQNPDVKTGPANDPVYTPVDPTPIKCVDTKQRIRDESGTLVGMTMRTLLVSTAGEIPTKDDKIIINGKVHGISEVRAIEPANEAVLYKVDLET